MKSIIFLLLTACCLFPFSSATFTSENPIILPTTTHDDNNIVLPAILDLDGNPLKTGKKYIIIVPMIGAGAVYWGRIGGTLCPNAVLQHSSALPHLGNGTAVKFVLDANDPDDHQVVREMFATNIMFSVETSSPCVNETVWKVGEHRYVVTDGTLGSESSVFKIQEYGIEIPRYKNVYKLMYCPPHYLCEDVSTTMDNGNLRLAISPTVASPFVFDKAKNA